MNAVDTLSPFRSPGALNLAGSAWRMVFFDDVTKMRLCIHSRDIWILRAYYELRLAGEAVTLSDKVEPERINIADIYNFGRHQREVAPFVAIVRADGHPPKLANRTIRQNETGNPDGGIHIPHWAQLSVIPRDARITTIEFKGAPINLDKVFAAPAFYAALAEFGISLHCTSLEAHASVPTDWGNYRACDRTLAGRSLTEYDARGKLASKPVNAWWSEAPAIPNPETAYRELRRSSLEIYRGSAPQNALAAIRRLQGDPGLYSRWSRTAAYDARNSQSHRSCNAGSMCSTVQWPRPSKPGNPRAGSQTYSHPEHDADGACQQAAAPAQFLDGTADP